MEYVYVTENNLENIQKYQYTRYGGSEFLDAYRASRHNALAPVPPSFDPEEALSSLLYARSDREGDLTERIDLKRYIYLAHIEIEASAFEKTDALLKTFEVRKLLYGTYKMVNRRLSPQVESGFWDLAPYAALCYVLAEAYTATKNLIYLNGILKLNDILISVRDRMDDTALLGLYSYNILFELKEIEALLKTVEGRNV